MPTDTPARVAPQATRLAAWLSPSFPIGAFSYSHGLERAVEAGDVGDEAHAARLARRAAALRQRARRGGALRVRLRRRDEARGPARGGGARAGAPAERRARARGGVPGAGLPRRRRETRGPTRGSTRSGAGTRKPALAPILPVVAGAACRVHGLPRAGSLALYLHAFVANLRLRRRAARAARPVGGPARRGGARGSDPRGGRGRGRRHALDDLGTACPMAEILSMQHETQYTRLFRS